MKVRRKFRPRVNSGVADVNRPRSAMCFRKSSARSARRGSVAALQVLLGPAAEGLSATNICRLKRVWEDEWKDWSRRDLSSKHYVYVWADGTGLHSAGNTLLSPRNSAETDRIPSSLTNTNTRGPPRCSDSRRSPVAITSYLSCATTATGRDASHRYGPDCHRRDKHVLDIARRPLSVLPWIYANSATYRASSRLQIRRRVSDQMADTLPPCEGGGLAPDPVESLTPTAIALPTFLLCSGCAVLCNVGPRQRPDLCPVNMIIG